MRSVAEITRDIIERKPFLEDALVRGIINFNSLAEEIFPEVKEKTRNSDVKLTTIAMALRRLSENLQQRNILTIEKKLQEFVDSQTTLRYDLSETTFEIDKKSSEFGNKIGQIYSLVPIEKGSYLSITMGTNEITVISRSKYEKEISNILRGAKIKSKVKNLAAVSITIPEDSLDNPGLFYYFTKALTMDGINIVELISTFSEMHFIVYEDDVSEASKTLRKILRKVEIENL